MRVTKTQLAKVRESVITTLAMNPYEASHLASKPGTEEELEDGSQVLYLEGGPEEWPWNFSEKTHITSGLLPLGVRVEPLSSWGLAVFREF